MQLGADADNDADDDADDTADETADHGADLDSEVDASRRELLETLRSLNDSSQRVHQALNDAAAAFIVVRDHLLKGGRASDFVGLLQPATLRQELSASLTELEQKRHRSQKLLFRLLCAEGMSMSDIGRNWGLSRQLVSRLVNEAD